jgi:hypothetical protein
MFIDTQFNLLNKAVKYNDKTVDDDLLFNLTCIIEVLDNLENKITEEQKGEITKIIISFINKVDNTNKKRKPCIETIQTVKLLSQYFQKIFNILKLDVEISTVDTSRDEIIAAELAHELEKPDYLNKATNAALKRKFANNS